MMRFLFRLAVLAMLVFILTGCRGMGNQKYSVLSKSPAGMLESGSSTVLDVRCSNVSMRADYNLWENLHMLAPRPKAWKFEVTFVVVRVVKGKSPGSSISLRPLRVPTEEESRLLGISYPWGGLTNGLPLRIGFDGRSNARLRNLRLAGE
jgi:hypothetical protein